MGALNGAHNPGGHEILSKLGGHEILSSTLLVPGPFVCTGATRNDSAFPQGAYKVGGWQENQQL